MLQSQPFEAAQLHGCMLMACRVLRAWSKGNVPIPTLKIWNEALGASHYRTACSRENERAFDPPIDASGLESGFCTALVPPRGRTHLFACSSNRVLALKGAI
jgi:hypothetical protein